MTSGENRQVEPLHIPMGYHILFWLIYTLFWHSIFSPSFWSFGGFLTSLIYTLVHAAVTYLNIYVLVPRLWHRSRRVLYTTTLIVSILLGAALLGVLLYLWFSAVSPPTVKAFFADVQLVLGSLLGSTFSGVALAMVIYLLLQRRRMEQLQERLRQEKMNAELQFLRSQLDPHFLFNALNNIYFLIKKDPDAAAEALSGFSDLLRYQIYQGREDQIPLAEEFDYLRRYADLAALRLPHEAEVEVRLPTPDSTYQISPLLLLPLVENAFKHVDKDRAKVKITGTVEDKTLHLEVVNSCESQAEQLSESRVVSGIGLENLNQRLALLYPGKSHYRAWQANNTYHAELKIEMI